MTRGFADSPSHFAKRRFCSNACAHGREPVADVDGFELLDSADYQAYRDRIEKIIYELCNKTRMNPKGVCTLARLKAYLTNRRIAQHPTINLLDIGFEKVTQDPFNARIQWVRTERSTEIFTREISITPANPRIEANLGL